MASDLGVESIRDDWWDGVDSWVGFFTATAGYAVYLFSHDFDVMVRDSQGFPVSPIGCADD